MKRAAFALVATVLGLVLLLGFKTTHGRTGTRPAAIAAPSAGSSQAPSTGRSAVTPPSTARSTASHPSSTTRPPGASHPSSAAHSVDGSPIATPYGVVQVRSTFAGGRLVGVTVLQAPSDNPQSQALTTYATPILGHEALVAGSAQIDIVSGASYTSDGYAQSLQSTLDKRNG